MTDRGNAGVAPATFAWLAIQAGLVLAAAILFHIELERGFDVIAVLIFGGFLIHAWLPVRFRVPFFVLLTITALAVLLRADAVWVVALGSVLLGLCHLPLSWGARVASILAVSAGLAAVRAARLEAPWGDEALIILAAMFMFRLILYLYDLKTDRTPASPWQRVAYFFLLPNVAFPLFPVVDYKTFLKAYYDVPAAEIYQKGTLWMLRGVGHLLLYRLVYFALPKTETELHGVMSVYAYMAMTLFLYLRVSGLFHLIAGSLCLFGFNLPRTNNYYFLASSFTDLWRRMNIYWKDFMMTVVFYPVFMRFRQWSMTQRLVVSTAIVFAITWFLHAYQWFWLQGELNLPTTDMAFWGVLGLVVVLNTVWEAKHPKRRRLGKPVWSWKEAMGLSLRTLGVFSLLAVLWLLWSLGSYSEWWYRVIQVRESTALDWAMFAGLIGGVLVAGIAGQWLSAQGRGLQWMERVTWRRAPVLVPSGALALVLLIQPAVHEPLGPVVSKAVSKAQSTALNWIDMERQERGYYETLSRSTRVGPQPLLAKGGVVEEGGGIQDVPGATVSTKDLRGFTLAPEVEVVYKGVRFRTNRWGQRDRPYEREKPPSTYRVALLGASYVMGSGVENEQTFENVLEDRLNRELAGRPYDRYEILNFAVGGYGDLQKLYLVDSVVPQFQPDVVMFVVHPGEPWRIVDRLRFALELGGEVGADYEFVNRILRETGAHADLPAEEFGRRLMPYREELLRWTYRQQTTACRDNGALPVFVFMPLTTREFDADELDLLVQIARSSGAEVLPLPELYRGHDPDEIRLTAGDHHPNPLGHRLIADRLYAEMMDHANVLRLTKARRDPPAVKVR